MGGPPAAKADRGALLNKMARDPGEALRRWASLPPSERLTVESQMKTYYGPEFARQFLVAAGRGPRPEASVEMVRVDRVTQAQLESAGYRFKDNLLGVAKWIHPTGKQVWIYPGGKAMPPNPHPPEPPVARPQAYGPQEITIGDADEWLHYLKAKRKLIREYEEKTRAARASGNNTVGSDADHFFKMVAQEIDDAAAIIRSLSEALERGNLNESEEQDALERIRQLDALKEELSDLI